MAVPITATTVTITSGTSVSSPFTVRGGIFSGMFVPILNSGSIVYADASYLGMASGAFGDVTSASFMPITSADRVSPWALTVVNSTQAVALSTDFHPFGTIRLRTSVAQADARHFVIFTRPE